MLAKVQRFVIGDEREGYTLCHPRFAEYVQGLIGRSALQTYTDALLNHCARWPEHRSRYALAYYASHLAEAGRWGDLHALVGMGSTEQLFAETRHAVEGNYSGYLRNLNRAWTHAEEQGHQTPEAIGHQIRYALIYASINSLASNTPRELLYCSL